MVKASERKVFAHEMLSQIKRKKDIHVELNKLFLQAHK